MTESAYSQELTSQNDASSQVYKDYILDYHFDKADIFVDGESSQAIAEVSYQVTYVSDLKNTEQAKTKQTETRLVKLSYAKLSGNLLVNKMEIWKSGLEDYKGKSIVEVAQSLGIDLKRISSHLYEHPDHDSFRIVANTNTFKWFSRDIQGDVIDFVRVTQNVSFKEALHYLAGQEFKAQEVQEISDIPFSYPLYQMEDKSFRLARAYLKEKRCLSDETINFFGRQGVLAQANWITKGINEPVVVFKSLDHRGLIQGASLQGIHDSALHKRGQLKKILKGSHGHN